MKLIVQIPCYNEEQHIIDAVNSIPRKYEGITKIEILIINDGSTDSTCDKLIALDDVHVLTLPTHVGLAEVFKHGIKKSLELGADIIVNFDADLQYDASEIKNLISPILLSKAAVVIGERPYWGLEHFSFFKKLLLYIGSKIISLVTGYNLRDAATGFRAFSKVSVKDLEIYSTFTYTLETLIFFSKRRIKLISIPLKKSHKTRPSRLFRTNFQYIYLSILTVVKTVMRYMFVKRNS